ncbi:MAG: PaeR7I family type II restriction endonuclease [Candidatus Krumholzibacteria bacterium]|nr:PaeR7I family type II restriction endonuclease [Candidatus Krumholzibacteria bacterium]
MDKILKNIDVRLSKAIVSYWITRESQSKKQDISGKKDAGARSAVTGGAQMDGVISLLTELLAESGVPSSNIFIKKQLQLPGFFRPTKEWDLLVISGDQLVIALEAKSQVGPSFGNNFNNRTEEAMGSALDLWTAFRKGAFNKSLTPWLGYLFLLEDCPASQRPVKAREPHFSVFPEFRDASYAKRYELFCRKLVRERQYSATCFLMSSRTSGIKGKYSEPGSDICFKHFVRSLIAQAIAFGKES